MDLDFGAIRWRFATFGSAEDLSAAASAAAASSPNLEEFRKRESGY